MDNDLLKLVEQAGFTEKEARVYLALLELGQGDVSDIAKIAELKRSIIYVILEGLIKRGYASEVPNKKINTYQAADPSVIVAQLKSVTKNFLEMLPFLQTLGGKNKKRPKMTYYETKEGIWKVYEEIGQAKDPFYITSYSFIEKAFPGSVEKWIKEDEKTALADGYHLVPNNPDDIEIGKKFSKANQRVRIIESVENLQMDFTIFENKLAITSLADSPFVVVIESEDLINSMRPIFEIAWRSGKDIKTE